MNRTGREQKMDLVLPLATTEALRPLVQQFLDKLSAVQWLELQSGSINEATEKILTDMCVDIINAVSTIILEAFKRIPPEGSDLCLTQSPPKSCKSSSGSDVSWKSIVISKDQVRECLGDTVSLTLAEVMGVQQDIRCQSAKEVTELVAKEVTERVNSELSKSFGRSGSSTGSSKKSVEVTEASEHSVSLNERGSVLTASKTSTGRLKMLVNNIVKILKKCAAEMTRSNDKKGPQSPQLEAVENGAALESCQTPVTPLREDDEQENISSSGSFVFTTTEAVKTILEEQASDISIIEYNDDLSIDEYDLLESSNARNTSETAAKIVSVIMEELKLESDGTSKSGSEPDAKPDKTSCWRRVVNKIKAFFVHKFAKESIISFVAKLRCKLDCFPQTEEKASLKLLIEGVDCLVEDMIPPEEDYETREGTDKMCLYRRIAGDISSGHLNNIANQLSDVVFHHLKLGKEHKVQVMVKIRSEVDKFMLRMWSWLDQQTQKHEQSRDLVSVALRQIQVVINPPALTEGPFVMERDTVTPAFEAAPSPVTDEPAICDEAACDDTTAQPVQEWDELCCVILVSGLVNQIVRNPSVRVDVSDDTIRTTIATLNKMLGAEIAGSDIAVKPSGRNIERTFKAVHKDLCEKKNSTDALLMNLLSKDPLIYEHIIETLKRHLVTPQKKTGVNAFFRSVFKTMAKPFSACFKRGREE